MNEYIRLYICKDMESAEMVLAYSNEYCLVENGDLLSTKQSKGLPTLKLVLKESIKKEEFETIKKEFGYPEEVVAYFTRHKVE